MAWAQSPAAPHTAPNGCGSGWSVYFVPNSLPLLQCDFGPSCDNHDLCYGRCEGRTDGDCAYRRCRPGGDLYQSNSARCVTESLFLDLGARAKDRRDSCDRQFYSALVFRNRGKAACEAFAVVYRDAVKFLGENAFSGADQFDGPAQNREDYERAIREFFEKGTEAQFRELVERAETPSPAVDMKKPLRFRPGRGLTNN